MGGEIGRIDRKRLILIAKIEIFLQTTRIGRVFCGPVAAILSISRSHHHFLIGFRVPTVDRVIEFREQRRSDRQFRRCPAKRTLGE